MDSGKNIGASVGRPFSVRFLKFIEVFAISALLLLFVMLLLGVVSRYFGLGQFEWSFELAGLSFIWLTFLGTVLAEFSGENAAFNPFDDRLSTTGQKVLSRLRALGLLLVASYLGTSSLAMIFRNGLMPSPILRWPQTAQTASILVCSVLIGLIAASRLLGGRKS